MIKLAVLISGEGSNLQAILDAIEEGWLEATVVVVLSNQPNAGGLQKARNANIPTHVINSQGYSDRELFERDLVKAILPFTPDYIVLAGFMRCLTPYFIDKFRYRILNIHPSLLPKYKGLKTHQRVLDNQETEHGATVHLVNEELDSGSIIAQIKTSIKQSDTALALKKRIQSLEHKLYPIVLSWLASHKLIIQETQLLFNHHPIPKIGFQLEAKKLIKTNDHLDQQRL